MMTMMTERWLPMLTDNQDERGRSNHETLTH